MRIIPVIDIRDGEAVRGIGGRRAEYMPLETPLAATSSPIEVALGLARRFVFDTLYIADLDAIEGRGDNHAAVEAICTALAGVRIWVDSGAAQSSITANLDIVIGSESIADLDEVSVCRDDPGAILSLDFLGDKFLGPPALLESPASWPKTVIVMTLDRVGAKAGPDFKRFEAIASRAGARAIFVAGGVRGRDDLLALQRAGAAGALVASALHDGRLTPDDVARFGAKA